MQIPLEVQAEWSSLTRTHSRVENLRSATIVREWLEGVETYLEGGGDPGREPVIYGHRKGSNTAGVTNPEYGGVSTSQLRFWLEWWGQPERTKHGAEEAGREPAVEIAKLRAELDARGASTS